MSLISHRNNKIYAAPNPSLWMGKHSSGRGQGDQACVFCQIGTRGWTNGLLWPEKERETELARDLVTHFGHCKFNFFPPLPNGRIWPFQVLSAFASSISIALFYQISINVFELSWLHRESWWTNLDLLFPRNTWAMPGSWSDVHFGQIPWCCYLENNFFPFSFSVVFGSRLSLFMVLSWAAFIHIVTSQCSSRFNACKVFVIVNAKVHLMDPNPFVGLFIFLFCFGIFYWLIDPNTARELLRLC